VGTKGSFPQVKATGDAKLTTHLPLVLRSRMVELYLPLPHMSSWHGQLYLYKMLYCYKMKTEHWKGGAMIVRYLATAAVSFIYLFIGHLTMLSVAQTM
jgi:hypothetical protein